MKRDSVPQDTAVTYGGQRKLFYAVDADGAYSSVHSSGWDVETAATLAAVKEYERLRDDAWQRAQTGAASPLEFHMYRHRLDLPELAQITGLWKWRVRRHFEAARFRKLSPPLLERYAATLGIAVAELITLPSEPNY